MKKEEFDRVFRCPNCGGKLLLKQKHCSHCAAPYSLHQNIVDFINYSELGPQGHEEIHLHRSLVDDYRKRYQGEFAQLFSTYWNEQYLRHCPKHVDLLLDCGCGTGELLKQLKPRANQVIGADISREMIQVAAEQGSWGDGAQFVVCPAETMPFADEIFDVVCFRGSLHHMSDERKALHEAHRVLKSGGSLILSEPNDDSLLLRIPRIIANRFVTRFGNEHKAFKSELWVKTIEEAGFSIKFTKYFSFFSQPLCGMSDLLPLMRYLPFAARFAEALIQIDEFCSHVPVLRRQSFDLFVVATKSPSPISHTL